MSERRLFPFPDRRVIRNFRFDEIPPSLAMTDSALIVYYPHIKSFYVFERLNDYEHVQTVEVRTDDLVVKRLVHLISQIEVL